MVRIEVRIRIRVSVWISDLDIPSPPPPTYLKSVLFPLTVIVCSLSAATMSRIPEMAN